jgi:hypothetical protein
MTKKQLAICKILCVFFCYFSVVSCNKTTITPENALISTEQPMSLAILAPLKLAKETYNGDFKQYTYNVNGQCTRIDMNQSYKTYNYRGNTIIETLVYSDPTKPNIVYTYTLNALGLAATCTFTIGTKSFLLEYVYNSDRQATKITRKSKTVAKPVYSIESTDLYKYNSDGDCTRYTYQLNFTNVMYDYDYDETRFNTTGNEFKGLGWLGKNSKHVVSLKITITGFYYPDWDVHTYFTNYNWTYDAQGYNKQYSQSGYTQGIATFTYR